MKIKDVLNDNQKKLALEQVLNLSIPELIINKEQELTKKEEKKYKKIEKELKKGKPIQYILKKAYFYNEKFYVNKNATKPTILDIGTGSGVIAITLNKLNNQTTIIATDISKKALKVAKKNQKTHNTNVSFKKTNLYKGINKKFDCIISNPPYIKEESTNIENQVKENEPHIALFAKEEGLFYYKKILKEIKNITKENHIICFEIGENQGTQIKNLIKDQFPKDKVIIKKDYNNYERYVFSISNE